MAEEQAKIQNDPRYHYDPALVQINAPLALIQCSMESEMNLLSRLARAALRSKP